MPQPACVACRWGTGTTCEKPAAKTPAAKEVEQKLEAMRKERAQQDERWFSPPSSTQPPIQAPKTHLNGTS